MDTLINFRRSGPDLELLKVQCWRSWFNTQTIPTETVEALIDIVEQLQTDLALAKLDAEIYEAMWENMNAKHNACVAESRARLASIREAIDWLWGFYDGNSLRAIPGYEDYVQDAWIKLLMVTEET